ncbi:hypothetical protein EMCRGX_G027090 [Ephydatia muelleri]
MSKPKCKGCAKCNCGDRCKCTEDCGGDCCLCTCLGCEGSACECGNGCKCTKGCCEKAKGQAGAAKPGEKCGVCKDCHCGSACKCTKDCGGHCCLCTCKGCDGSPCKCSKGQCKCDKGCC